MASKSKKQKVAGREQHRQLQRVRGWGGDRKRTLALQKGIRKEKDSLSV